MPRAIFTSKPTTLTDLQNPYRTHSTEAESYIITETLNYTQKEYDDFGNWLLQPKPEFEGKGGVDAKTGKTRCIAIKAEGRKTLLVNPEGYDYARYVAYAR